MKQILLVDDDLSFLDSLKRHFRPYRHEWQLETAVNGMEAMRLVREKAFDLVITDILMPVQDGIETVNELRRDYPSIKVIAISGGGRYIGRECLVHAKRLGAHETLEKPFDPDDLMNTVRSLLTPDPVSPAPTGESN